MALIPEDGECILVWKQNGYYVRQVVILAVRTITRWPNVGML